MSIRLEGVGGQTGMEGSCVGPEVEALPFSIEQAQRLLLGSASDSSVATYGAAQGKAMRVDVALRGEPETDLNCGGRLIQPVEVTLSFDEPPLDLAIEEMAYVFTSDVAVLQRRLPLPVAQHMGLAVSDADEAATLTMFFGVGGLRGLVEASSNCSHVVFPAGRRCMEGGSNEQPLTPAAHTALDGFAELHALPHTWPGGETTSLSIELETTPESMCTGYWPQAGLPGSNPSHLLVRTRVRSADGRLDLSVPGQLEFDAPDEDGWGGWSLHLDAMYPPGTLAEGERLELPRAVTDVAWLALNVWRAEGEVPRAELRLNAAPAKAGAPSASRLDLAWGHRSADCYLDAIGASRGGPQSDGTGATAATPSW